MPKKTGPKKVDIKDKSDAGDELDSEEDTSQIRKSQKYQKKVASGGDNQEEEDEEEEEDREPKNKPPRRRDPPPPLLPPPDYLPHLQLSFGIFLGRGFVKYLLDQGQGLYPLYFLEYPSLKEYETSLA